MEDAIALVIGCHIMCHVWYFKTRLARLNIVAIVGDIHDLKLVVKFSD